MSKWWNSLSESTRRSVKTLWQTFVFTFLVTLAAGLTNGIVGLDALASLVIAALSAALAAVAAKVVNLGKDKLDELDNPEGTD